MEKVYHKKRVAFCNWFIYFTQHVVWNCNVGYEAWINLGGCVNSQNSRISSLDNLHSLGESPLHSQTIGVWCAMFRMRIIGSIIW